MKYILSFVGVVVIVLSCVFMREENKVVDADYMRIHIVGNSNSVEDQNVKYLVKDAVVEFLIPELSQAENKESAKQIIISNIPKITEVANQTLRMQGKNYTATVSIAQEDIPTRSYDDLVLESGIYECLKISLGQGKGDNWWCVVFPAVCFINSKNPANYEYISKIWEILNNV